MTPADADRRAGEERTPELTALEGRIAALFKEQLGLDVPSADADLMNSGILDSLTWVELILRIEETFGLHIAMEELDPGDFRSVAAIAAFVAQRGQHREGAR